MEVVLNEINNGNIYFKQRYEGENIEEQVKEYLKDKTFIDNKLFAVGLFAYKKNLVKDKNYNLMTDWFFHSCYWSIQDQISLPYLLHKHNVKYTTFNFNIFRNPHVIHCGY